MKYSSHTNAWAFSSLKDTAIFFDKIHVMRDFLFDGIEDAATLLEIPGAKEMGADAYKVGDDPLMVCVAPNVFVLGRVVTEMQIAMIDELYKQLEKEPPNLPFHTNDMKTDLQTALRALMIAVDAELSGKGSLILPNPRAQVAGDEETAVLLTGLRLIDTSTMSWPQILELRRDVESVKRLRALRMFVFDNYSGKDAEFVRDDLLRRVEVYEATANKWGADMREGSIDILLGNEVKLSAVGAVAALAEGRADLALVSAVPLLFQIAKVGLNIRKQRRESSFDMAYNQLAYLIDVKRACQA